MPSASSAMLGIERAGGPNGPRLDHVAPSNTQVSPRPGGWFHAPPKSTTSFPRGAMLHPKVADGAASVTTRVQAAPSNVHVLPAGSKSTSLFPRFAIEALAA